ncbi:MAG: replication initiation factor domain-containing protein [Rhodoferax sp.]|nr:MAG: replication initiation factor domain-containing protein [Rhodoferax sp.]
MTFKNPLVLDGNEVKLRLQAERHNQSGLVHVDWLRFTCPLRCMDMPRADHLFPNFNKRDAFGIPLPIYASGDTCLPEKLRIGRLLQLFKDATDEEFLPTVQAYELAEKVAKVLGEAFQVRPQIGKGHDFYKYRWSIDRNGNECGWVGFLSSSDALAQRAQAETLHVNLYGHACTFADFGWREAMADLIEEHQGKVPRCDLALDFFDGAPWRFDDLHDMHRQGLFDVKGKRPKCHVDGDWTNGAERSYYVGSRSTGKETNLYEKGDQLYGREAKNPWVRVETRWGNKSRELPAEMLRRPDDFFAAASDWHAAQLTLAGAQFTREKLPCHQKLPLESVAAEVSRNVRWAFNTARQTFATLHKFLDVETLVQLVDFQNVKKPGRLQKFSDLELAAAFASTRLPAAEGVPAFALAA